jgi:2-oxoglutarate ferredoxin oxidoreductase subunit gamma
MERCRMVFTGSGGQGVITAAIVIAEAAAIYEDLSATQTQSYGPEARGGATRADVIISDGEIRFPKVIQANVMVCLTQQSYNKYSGYVRPGGLLLTDSKYVKTESKVDARQIQLPMYQTVMEQVGKPIVYNICVLGVVIGLTGVIGPDSIMKVLEKRIPPDFLALNRKALDVGLAMSAGLTAAAPDSYVVVPG